MQSVLTHEYEDQQRDRALADCAPWPHMGRFFCHTSLLFGICITSGTLLRKRGSGGYDTRH